MDSTTFQLVNMMFVFFPASSTQLERKGQAEGRWTFFLDGNDPPPTPPVTPGTAAFGMRVEWNVKIHILQLKSQGTIGWTPLTVYPWFIVFSRESW